MPGGEAAGRRGDAGCKGCLRQEGLPRQAVPRQGHLAGRPGRGEVVPHQEVRARLHGRKSTAPAALQCQLAAPASGSSSRANGRHPAQRRTARAHARSQRPGQRGRCTHAHAQAHAHTPTCMHTHACMHARARTRAARTSRYCEEKFIQKYVPTIGVDYGVKPVKLGDYEARGACGGRMHAKRSWGCMLLLLLVFSLARAAQKGAPHDVHAHTRVCLHMRAGAREPVGPGRLERLHRGVCACTSAAAARAPSAARCLAAAHTTARPAIAGPLRQRPIMASKVRV